MLISNRSWQRAPNLTSVDRFVLGLATLLVRPQRLLKLGALVRPATLLKFHEALVQWKYRRLFSSSPSPRRKPGPKGPSWLTFIAEAKDSLWSVDLFRCESILLHSHWVLVVIDVSRRRIVGFGIERASIDGMSVCRMFNHAVTGRLCSASIGSGTNRPRCGTVAELWHDRGVIALPQMALRLLADLAGLVVLSLRPRRSLEAENLVLRLELALYQERGVKPRRVDAATAHPSAAWTLQQLQEVV